MLVGRQVACVCSLLEGIVVSELVLEAGRLGEAISWVGDADEARLRLRLESVVVLGLNRLLLVEVDRSSQRRLHHIINRVLALVFFAFLFCVWCTQACSSWPFKAGQLDHVGLSRLAPGSPA